MNFLFFISLKSNFFSFSKHFPVSKSGGGSNFVLNHSGHGFLKMVDQIVQKLKDLGLEFDIALSFFEIKVLHVHVFQLVVNIVVTNFFG